ncbi:hypothetical protein L873DRAFT_1662387, partial [Choiromyces venosus 120613-1]
IRHRITLRKPFPNSKATTIEAWGDEWRKLEVDTINSLIEKIPQKLQKCIRDNGGNHFQG